MTCGDAVRRSQIATRSPHLGQPSRITSLEQSKPPRPSRPGRFSHLLELTVSATGEATGSPGCSGWRLGRVEHGRGFLDLQDGSGEVLGTAAPRVGDARAEDANGPVRTGERFDRESGFVVHRDQGVSPVK